MDTEDKDPTVESPAEDQPEVFAVSREEKGVRYDRRKFIELASVATVGTVVVANLGLGQQEVLAQAATATRAPRPTRTPRPENTVTCSVRTDRDDVTIHVGPGRNRGIRMYMQPNEDIPVIGQGEDRQGNLWWQLQVPNVTQAWVADEDVETSGNCGAVGVSPTPPIATAQSNQTATPKASEVPPGQVGSVPPGETGINYSVNGTTYTLPCGSPLPAGAVCVCNCVTVCSCDGYVAGCSCDSYVSSSHYWYPN